MSKSVVLSSEVVTPAVPASETVTAPEVVITQPRPNTIELNGLTHIVMASAAYLCRLGYIPVPDIPPTIHTNTGYATMLLCIGSPDEYAMKVANDAIARATAVAQRDYEKDVAAAAAKLVETAARAKAQAELEAEIAATKLAVRRLEAKRA